MGALTAADLMTPNPLNVLAEDSLLTAYDIMESNHIRHLLVVDKEGELQGLLSQRDLMRSAVLASESLPLSEERRLMQNSKVLEVFTREPETILEDLPITDAGRLLFENKYGCLPVMRGQTPVGILTESDFVRYFIQAPSPTQNRDQGLESESYN